MNNSIVIRCADIYLRFPEIMEEECNDLADFLEDEHIVYEGATDIFIDQKNKLDKYKEVINKTIVHIDTLLFDLNRQNITFEYWEEILNPIKDILKGDNK